MSKPMKPERLGIIPAISSVAKYWWYWKKIFENYLESFPRPGEFLLLLFCSIFILLSR